MKILLSKDHAEMSKKAANILAAQIYMKPNCVLGLATGSTPLSMYKELIKMHKEEGLDFSETTTFNLDEYIGLSEKSKNSYHYYMHQNFFDYINVKNENINIPNGMAKDIAAECIRYENKIAEAGGLDLLILGIGKNGHIGFNEPDIKFETKTHKVQLDYDTIAANARFFGSIEEVPKFAISMGIGTIMQAKKILLLASGKNKAEAIYKTINGIVSPDTPASILQLHPDVTISVDYEGAELLEKKVSGGL